jgi:hypothetical protein
MHGLTGEAGETESPRPRSPGWGNLAGDRRHEGPGDQPRTSATAPASHSRPPQRAEPQLKPRTGF